MKVFFYRSERVNGQHCYAAFKRLAQFSSFRSVQDDIYALGKAHMRSTPSLRSFPNVAFETVPVFVLLTMALSRPFMEDRLALSLSTPLSCDQWCHVLGFVPAGSVSSFSTLQIFREASHLRGLLCPPVCLLGSFPVAQLKKKKMGKKRPH